MGKVDDFPYRVKKDQSTLEIDTFKGIKKLSFTQKTLKKITTTHFERLFFFKFFILVTKDCLFIYYTE